MQPDLQVVAVNGQPVQRTQQPMQPPSIQAQYPGTPAQYLPPFSRIMASVEGHASMIPWYVWLGAGLYIGMKYLKGSS